MWEECTSKLVGTFVPTGNGTYRGTFKDAPLVVRLAPMPEGTPPPETNDTVDNGTPATP
jgi:hypothetical protein